MCPTVVMRFVRAFFTALVACLLLAALAVGQPPEPGSRVYPAIVQSLATGAYEKATVALLGSRATVSLPSGKRVVLIVELPGEDEPEEILGRDNQDQYWAVYIDWSAKPVQPHAPTRGVNRT